MDEARVRYWLARLEDDRKLACKLYRDAVFLPGLTFYSWQSLAQLRRSDPECAKTIESELRAIPAADPVAMPPALTASPIYRRASKLGEIGLIDRAVVELALLQAGSIDAPTAVALAMAYHRLGAHFEAQTLLRRYGREALHSPPTRATRAIWEAAYSRPFVEEIAAAAEQSKVDPLLLTALSREESTFDPAIVSWAGAIGLAQIMPATAVGAAADLKLGRLSIAQILDPATNLKLGAHVLHEGLAQFNDAVPLALAAYNGGAGLVKRTLPGEGDQPFELWVESIPVRETRRYVQRVAGTWGIYRFLYDRDRPFIELPEKVP